MDVHTEPSAGHGKPVTRNQDSDRGYASYVWVRDQVVEAIGGQRRKGVTSPSKYWSEELEGFDYMLEASPLLVQKLRQQSYHLTGIKHYEYRSSQDKLRASFVQKLAELKKADTTGLFIPEHQALGGFGHDIDGALVNIDTLKFYESLIALDKGGVLAELRQNDRNVALEIGAGWGGFAYQFVKTVPNTTYVVVDFPEVILFSATYLKTLFPKSQSLIVKSAEDRKELRANAKHYDFIFIPQEQFQEAWDQSTDLAINMVSFQEMTSEQVDNYARRLAETGTKRLYSHNRERSKHNEELSAVSEILGRHFDFKRVHFMDGDYTNLNAHALGQRTASASKSAPTPLERLAKKVENRYRRFVKEKLLGEATPPPVPKAKKGAAEWMTYRHLIGTPKAKA